MIAVAGSVEHCSWAEKIAFKSNEKAPLSTRLAEFQLYESAITALHTIWHCLKSSVFGLCGLLCRHLLVILIGPDSYQLTCH